MTHSTQNGMSERLSFRSHAELVEQTNAFARLSGMSRSDYLRKAIEEKNERTLAERIAFLSRALSAKHLEINETMDASLRDGLAERSAEGNLCGGLRASNAQAYPPRADLPEVQDV